MNQVNLSRFTFLLIMLLVAIVSSAGAVGVMCIEKPWQADIARSRARSARSPAGAVTLRWDTPVTHEWRDAEGVLIGSYTTTLYEYTDDGFDIGELTEFRREMSTLAHWIASDPEMRGHLIAHGMTAEQLDYITSRFEADPDMEAYLAYHAK